MNTFKKASTPHNVVFVKICSIGHPKASGHKPSQLAFIFCFVDTVQSFRLVSVGNDGVQLY
jgi:hypothetical protein